MTNMSDSRMGGVALAGGAFLYLIAALIRPGSILIDPVARASTQVERVRVLAENAPLTHVSTLLGSFALLTLLFGFFVLRRHLRDHSAGDGVMVLGIVFLAFGAFFIAAAGGMNHMIAHTINHGGGQDLRTLYTAALNIQLVKAGIVIIAGYGFLLGFGLISFGLWLRLASALQKNLALAAALVSLASLVVLSIGDHYHDWADELYTLANFAVLPLNLWAIIVGIGVYRGDQGLGGDAATE